MIGMEVVNSLFDKKPEKAVNKDILIDNQRFLVVGVIGFQRSIHESKR
jgi:hypothetical protein